MPILKNMMLVCYWKILIRSFVLILPFLLLIYSSFLRADPATEQVNEENNSVRSQSQDQIESITVTAQKRKQSLQQIPISINVLGEQDIVNLNVVDMKTILALFPNLSANTSTELITGFSIRGIGTNNPHGNVNQAVGIYRDEVAYGIPFSGILGVFDTERVEVLRGPQNSLFGRNTIGGAVHYISAKPSLGDDRTTGYVRANLGRFNQLDLTAVVNAELSSNLALRLSGQSVKRDGIYTNLAFDAAGNALGAKRLGDKNRQSARVQLLWQPYEQTDILFNHHWAKHDGTNIGNRAFGTRDVNDPYLLINGTQDFSDASEPDNKASISSFIHSINANFVNVLNSVDRNGFNPATDDWHHIYNVSSARSYADINGGFVKLEHQFDNDYQLQLNVSYDNSAIQSADETSGTNSLQFIPNRDATYQQQSYDLRILSADDENVRWLAGIYHFVEDMELYTIVRRFNYIGPQNNVPRDITAHNILLQEDKDFSFYGQVEWLLAEDFTLTSGLRFTENKKQANSRFGVAANYNTNPSGGGSISNMPFNTHTDFIFDRVPTDAYLGKSFIENCYSAEFTDCVVLAPSIKNYDLNQNLTEWGGKLALDYQIDPNKMVYASYARGFKSGGFDTRALAAFFGEGAEQAFLPEFLDAFELGLKAKLSRSLQFNSAIFYNLWQDLQTFGVFNGEPRYVNIPESSSRGIEAEIKWVPKDSWFMQLGLGVLDTQIVDNGTLTAADIGHELPNSPKLTLNSMLSKKFITQSGEITLQVDARYVSKQIDGLTYVNDRFTTKEAQLWLNARVNYQFGAEQQYQVALWAENLTKETYCVDIGMQNTISPTTTHADIGERGIDLTSTITCQPSETSGERLAGISIGVNFY
ncbi:TonB-dependent receptor [Paraglaciecola aquimarina]|uniref:TonB-dependent receptor n=1 Tax=Paraglaciecola algarum TaxID=3050085 RepID=A0ABS9DA75_9ALTE|nr:TonB-dependent receptor [Paraglaciecola sp. G1-23]MCF2949857.1 TonB-dependent receptor [Paraglaciecola sp. G1-23]